MAMGFHVGFAEFRKRWTLGLGLVQRAERADKSAAEGGGEWGIYKQKDMGCYDCDATVRVVES